MLCFNPRVLAGGRDPPVITKSGNDLVSIHASSREDATVLDMVPGTFLMFQSTRPRGRTRLDKTKYHAMFDVSIHASSREDATDFRRLAVLFKPCFNPRVLAGGRDRLKITDSLTVTFQSTRPRGRTRL